MAQEEAIELFGEKQIRVVWDDVEEKYYFSVVDIVHVLTESVDSTAYWRKLKQRLKEEGNETVTNCHALKMTAADGKQRLTDVADTEHVLRIIQSIPSKKAEPFKQWLAQVGAEQTATDLSKERNPEGLAATAHVAKDGAEVARNARADIEQRLGHSVISDKKAIDYITPKEELPFEK